MSDIISLGLWIKRRRKALDLTQDELAQRVGCSLETVRKIEADARRPSREIAALLAEKLELPAEQRAPFIQAARSELGADRLAPPNRSAARGALVPEQHTLSAADAPGQRRATRPNNLPAPLTTLIGRAREIEQICTLVRCATIRLLTLTGPGGIGKTRLSLQAAAGLAEEEFADGVYFVDLAPIRDPQLISTAIAETLGVREAGGQPLLATLKEYLRDKRMLLVLDNFEHLLSAAPLVAELLASAAQLKVLATSREVLHLRGEHEIVVPPLAVPDPTHLPALDQLAQYAAVALFIERVQASQSNFQLTNANAPAVAEICVRLDGLPLAIELAAARSKLFPPGALLARLSSRLALLTGGARDLPARQQTLRHTIAWSYDLLNVDEQRLFRRLGVFVGGCTLGAAEGVLGSEDRELEQGLRTEGQGLSEDALASILSPRPSVLDGLAALVDKSLLQQSADGDEPRLIMLETVREYALEQLELNSEAAAIRRQHAAYYLSLAEAAESPLRGASRLHLARLETEHDNLRAALTWARGSDDAEVFVRLAGALGRFWDIQGPFSEGNGWLAQAVARSSTVGAAVRAKALYQAGILVDHPDAGRWLEQSLALYQELERPQEIADVLVALGWRAASMGDYVRAETWLEASLPLFRNIGSHLETAGVLLRLGVVARWRCDYMRAGPLLEEGLALFRSLGNTFGIAMGSLRLGQLARAQGNDARAAACYDEALAMAQAAGYKDMIGAIRHNQAYLMLHQDEHARAEALLVETLVVSRAIGNWEQIARGLAVMGGVAVAQGQPERAARLLGAAEAWFNSIGYIIAQTERVDHDGYIAAARAELGEDAFAAAWAHGRALTLEQAMAEALAPS